MRMWIAASGPVDEGVLLYEADLPACCQRSAGAAAGTVARDGGLDDRFEFECTACGAVWGAAPPVEAEGDAFMTRGAEERKGAA